MYFHKKIKRTNDFKILFGTQRSKAKIQIFNILSIILKYNAHKDTFILSLMFCKRLFKYDFDII